MTATLTEMKTATEAITITIARSALRTALAKLAGAVDTKAKAHVIAQHVRLEVADGRLTLAATDFEAFVRLSVSCESTGRAVTLLPAKRLAEIVASLPPVGAVTLTITRSVAVLSAGRARFEMATMSPEEFPAFPAVKSEHAPVVIPVAPFLDALSRAVAHASVEDARPALNVARLEPAEDGLLVTGLHGQHLARLACPIADGSLAEGRSIHRTSVPVLTRLFAGLADDATLSFSADEYRAQLDGPDVMALVRLVDLPFPDYGRAIAGVTSSRTITCDRVLLAGAIKRVALSSGQARRIELAIGRHEIEVRAAEAGLGTAADVVPLEGATGETEPLTLPMHADFMLTALGTISSAAVVLAMDTTSKPVLFRADDQADADPTVVLVQPLASLTR